MTPVNFIPAKIRARRQVERRRATWFRFLRAYAAVLALGCALTFLLARAAAPSLESTIARLDRRIEASSKSLDVLKKQAAALAKRLETARLVSDHPDWSALLGALAQARGDDAMLESFDLVALRPDDRPPANASATAPKLAKPSPARESFAITLSGASPSLASCLRFVRNLESMGIFEHVAVKDTRQAQIGRSPAMHFEVEAAIVSSMKLPPAPSQPKPQQAATGASE